MREWASPGSLLRGVLYPASPKISSGNNQGALWTGFINIPDTGVQTSV